MEQAHISWGKFPLVKFVIAPGAMKTDEPNKIAENNRTAKEGDNKGATEPKATLVKIIDNGSPFLNLAKTERQINGDMQMNNPSTTQMVAIMVAFMDWTVIQADKNVR